MRKKRDIVNKGAEVMRMVLRKPHGMIYDLRTGHHHPPAATALGLQTWTGCHYTVEPQHLGYDHH